MAHLVELLCYRGWCTAPNCPVESHDRMVRATTDQDLGARGGEGR